MKSARKQIGPGRYELVPCPTCPGNVHLKVPVPAAPSPLAPPRLEIAPGRFMPLRNPLQVRSISIGIGDALMTLLIAEGLRRTWDGDVVVVAGRKHHPWLRLFDGTLATDRGFAGPERYCEHDVWTPTFAEFRRRDMARWDLWAEKFGTTATLPAARPFAPATVEWAMDRAQRVVLAPFAAHPDRTWPLDRWLELERRLLDKDFLCVVLDDRAGRTDAFQSPRLIRETPERVAAVIAAGRCFVGNDSGMAHLAGMLRVPGVALCSRTSDANIMGCYPTFQSLGGRQTGLESVWPDQVLSAVTAQVRGRIDPEFPAERFAATLLPRDRKRLDHWLPIYAALWRTVRELNPRRIVEIGSRAGQSAWTMLDACPQATVVAFDIDAGDDARPDGEASGGGFHGAHEHARAINPERFTLTIADSHTLDRLPPCDGVFIDGDHTRDGALADLRLAERSGAKWLLVDDYAHLREVREACQMFLAESPGWRGRYIANGTGLYLLERGPA